MKPKVLIFIDWFKPGYKAGGPTTSNVNIVDHLSDRFDFYVITSDTDYHASSPYPDVVPDRWTARDNCQVWYFSKDKLNFSSMMKAAKEADCPVWYVNGIYSRFFSIYPLLIAKRLKPTKLIVSARGMLSPHTFLVKPLMKKAFLLCMKLLGMYKNVEFHGTNNQECVHIRTQAGTKAKCAPIENLPRKLTLKFSPSTKQTDEIRLVSFARISPEKNTLYAIEALRHCKSNVVYDIYGQINSEAYWNECKSAMENLPANVKVFYRGSVNPKDMASIYHDHDALYLPTTGENFGHAILESLMNSRPVIISDRTPWRNLADKNIGVDLPLDVQDAYANAVDNMAMMQGVAFEKLCRDSYDFAKTICDNTLVKEQYVKLFSSDEH